VLKANEQTAVFQRTKVKDLKPGTQVLVRGAAPAGYQPTASATPPEWVMGTVSRVDTGANQIVLTDGTIVRVTPSTSVHRGADRVALAQLEPGSEIVVRVPSTATTTGSAEGSASPGQTPGARMIEAAEVNVVWMPPTGTR
jgi:hypothetical protein